MPILEILNDVHDLETLQICIIDVMANIVPLVNISRSFPHSWLITEFVARLAWRVSLVEQVQLTLPEHTSSSPVLSGVRVTRSLVLYVCFVDRCLPFCTFSFDHYVVCSSSICGFWLPLWYLQTLPCSTFFVNKKSKMSRIFLSMCDVKIFLTFTSPNMVLLWQLFYLFCSCI